MPEPLQEALPEPGTLAFPAPGEVVLWWARLDPGHLSEPTRARLRADLDAARLQKLARLHQEADRDRGLAGHALLRRVLAGMTGDSPAELRFAVHCAACGSDEHGKPYLVRDGAGAAPRFNLSHSGPVVAVALSLDRSVGVDVEASRRVDWNALRRSVFADPEWRATEGVADPDRLRTQLWSRKEAAVKASGHGLALPLNQVVVHGDPAGAALPDPSAGPGWSTRLPEGSGTAWGRDLDLGAGVGGAVAVHARPGEGRPIEALSVLFVAI